MSTERRTPPLDPRLLRHAAAARTVLLLGGVLAAGQLLATIGIAWYLAETLGALVGGLVPGELGQAAEGVPLAQAAGSVTMLLAALVLRAACTWLMELSSARGASTVKGQLRSRLIEAVLVLGPGRLGRFRSGGLAAVAGQGLDALDSYFGRYLPQLILTAVMTPGLVAVLFLADWLTGLTVLITLPLIPVFMALIGWVTEAVQQRQWRQLTQLAGAFLDVIAGLATLKIFRREHRQAGRIRSLTEEYRSRTMAVLRVSFLSSFVLELAASLAVAVVAVSIGLRLISGELALSVGLFVLLLAPEVFLPIRQVGAQFHASAQGAAAAADVFEVLDAAAAVTAPAVLAPAGAHPGTAAVLVLEAVSVQHQDAAPLPPLSAAVPAAALTVLDGPSGAGKSSLVAALLGFADFEGDILLHGRALAAVERRGLIAWADQHPATFTGTVAENIALGTDPGQIDAALLARVQLLAGCAELDPGHRLDREGGGLSGGQAQRLGLARAYYRALSRDCPLIVLDEPSSAVEAEREQQLIEGMRTLAAEGFAVLVISHRPALAQAADHRVTVAAAEAGAAAPDAQTGSGAVGS